MQQQQSSTDSSGDGHELQVMVVHPDYVSAIGTQLPESGQPAADFKKASDKEVAGVFVEEASAREASFQVSCS